MHCLGAGVRVRVTPTLLAIALAGERVRTPEVTRARRS